MNIARFQITTSSSQTLDHVVFRTYLESELPKDSLTRFLQWRTFDTRKTDCIGKQKLTKYRRYPDELQVLRKSVQIRPLSLRKMSTWAERNSE